MLGGLGQNHGGKGGNTLSMRKNRMELVQAMSTNKQNKWIGKLKHLWKSQDVYGEKVEFSYKGKHSYKTSIGAFFSLCAKAIVGIILGYLLYIMFSRKHPLTHMKPGLNDFEEPMKPFERGFRIAIGSSTETIDVAYGHWKAEHVTYKYVDEALKKEIKELELEECEYKEYSSILTAKQFERYGLSKFLCLKDSEELEINGANHFNEVYEYITISLEQCVNSTTSTLKCKTQTAIDSYFNNQIVSYPFSNTIFDFKEFDNPVKSYMDDTYSFTIDKTLSQSSQLFLQSTGCEKYDDLFKFWYHQECEFYQVKEVRTTQTGYSDHTYLTITIRLDQQTLEYVRQVETIFETAERIGGFKETIFEIGLLLCFFFQDRLFKGSFIRQLYQVKAKSQQRPQGSHGSKVADSSATTASMNALDSVNKNNEVMKSISKSEKLKEDDLKTIEDAILNRKRFFYSYGQIAQYLLHFTCCRNIRRNKHNNLKPQFLYHKGEEKLENELDIVNIIKSLRKLKLMSKVLFSSRKRMLLKFQRKNIIETTTSSSDSDEHRFDTMKLLDSDKDLVKLSVVAKIKRSMKAFTQKQLEKQDKILMNGIFMRSAKEVKDEDRKKENTTGGPGGLFGGFGGLGGGMKPVNSNTVTHDDKSHSDFDTMKSPNQGPWDNLMDKKE